ncbi:MAG: DEAD/DEAH box helicase [Chitinophagales bacterium]
MQQIEFNKEFEQALNLMENTDEHVFLTGRAGTGKSTLLQHFRQTTKKKAVILAPTGVAAINVKGQTIHSFFGFPPHPVSSDHIRKRKDRKLFEELDVIIIDEISMVRADMLDAINYFMRVNGKYRSRPFGGVQMIFIGDLFQLPPVVSNDVEKRLFEFMYETPFFYSSQVLYNVDVKYIELKKVYRQKDGHFLGLLDQIRTKNLDYFTLRHLNERYKPYFVPPKAEKFITLTSTNAIAQRINEAELEKLSTKRHLYQGSIEGKFEDRRLPNDMLLNFKEGAQVMFVRNDPYQRWVNGTIGTIQYLDADTISVRVETEKGEVVHTVGKEKWELLKYVYNEEKSNIDTEVLGSFEQYPLKLAWAITIHKSQGKTFDKVLIDMGRRGAFAPGQIYVALSRCTTLEGIVLKNPIKYNDIIVDERVLEFAAVAGIYR